MKSHEARTREREGRLTRELILDAGVAFIEEHGLRHLTMRRLGAELEVQAMALYRYVPSREDLLDGIVERVMWRLRDNPDVALEPRNGWQDYLVRLAHGMRQLAFEYPQVFPVVATRPARAPWILPPLRSLAWIENFLSALTTCGFSDSAAAEAYKSFSSFLLGHLLLHVAIDEEDKAAEKQVEQTGLADFPLVQRLQPLMENAHSTDEFEAALEDVLNRIELVSARQGGR